MKITKHLSKSSTILVDKFNICSIRYLYYLEKVKKTTFSDSTEYINMLDFIKREMNNQDSSILILKFVMQKLEKFAETYDVDVEITDDFKIIYFISLYFLRENSYCKEQEAKKIILVILHQVMCATLLAYEPKIILDKLDQFIRKHDYDKFYEEYGDIGYYHMIKSIYFMQRYNATSLMDKDILESGTFVASYFKEFVEYE